MIVTMIFKYLKIVESKSQVWVTEQHATLLLSHLTTV